MCIVLEVLLLKLHECGPLVTRSSLQGGHFGPIQKIRPKVGCEHSFEGGCSFTRLQYVWFVRVVDNWCMNRILEVFSHGHVCTITCL